MGASLEHGTSYFTFDTDVNWLLSQAIQEARRGRGVLVITRRPRKSLERRHHMDGIESLHFTTDKSMKDISRLNPENIGRIFTSIKDFLERNEEGLVIFDGADLLSFYNGFAYFIKLLYTLNDVVWSSGGCVAFLIDPTTFHARELHIIQKELVELPNPRAKVDIEDAHEK